MRQRPPKTRRSRSSHKRRCQPPRPIIAWRRTCRRRSRRHGPLHNNEPYETCRTFLRGVLSTRHHHDPGGSFLPAKRTFAPTHSSAAEPWIVFDCCATRNAPPCFEKLV